MTADLVSPDYRALLQAKHGEGRWGKAGASWAGEVAAFAKVTASRSVLDYGCGGATLGPALVGTVVNDVRNYDPGIPGLDGDPSPADLVVATDVLEHIEPDRLDAVLDHIAGLMLKAAFFNIALSPSRTFLADGRNAHLIVRPTPWWLSRLGNRLGAVAYQERKGLCVWIRK